MASHNNLVLPRALKFGLSWPRGYWVVLGTIQSKFADLFPGRRHGYLGL